MSEQPSAEFLRRLRPIPTYRDHPATTPVDIEGHDPGGEPVHISVSQSVDPVLLLFLSADCLGCRDLWAGTAELRRAVPAAVRPVIVTRGPEAEDAGAIATLAPADVTTVMSTPAYRDYRVGGPPFLVVVTAAAVLTEGVAWGIEETARATTAALSGSS